MRIRLTICVLLLASIVSAQSLVYQAGLRGGPALYMGSGEGAQWGETVGIDGRVGFVHDIGRNRNVRMGFLTGAEVSYLHTSLGSGVNDRYTNYDYYGHAMNYSITAENAYRGVNALNVAVPIYYTFLANGFRLNLGPKFLINAYSSTKVVLDNVHIDAYYPDYGVTVHDALITGRLADGTYEGGTRLPILTLAISAEVGYEWEVDEFFPYENQRVGLTAYVDYGMWNTLSGKPSVGSLIAVAPITDRDNPVPGVTVNGVTEGYVGGLHYLSAGIRLYWCFEDMHRPSYGIHRKWW